MTIKEYRLGEVARISSGKILTRQISAQNYISTDNMCPNLGGVEPAENLPSTSKITKFKRGDTLFSNIRTYFRKVWYACFDGGCSPDVLVFSPIDATVLDNQYLYFLLCNTDFINYTDLTSKGAKMPRGDKDAILAYELKLPPLPEQKRIAHILGTLDDKIELNRRMNATLEAMAQALFKSWFVDFDPVRAKQQGRQPTGMDPATAELFPSEFEESELGPIPKGWEIVSIYEIAKVIYGAPFASKRFNSIGEGRPLIRIRDLSGESPKVWTDEVHSKGYLVKQGDIVVGMDGEFRAYLWGGKEAWLNQRVCVFVPKLGTSAAFVRNAIMEPLAHVEATETATTVIHLGKGDIDRFRTVTPGNALQEAFTRNCQPLYDKIVANKLQSRTPDELRDLLLPKLLSGALTTSDNEAIAEVSA